MIADPTFPFDSNRTFYVIAKVEPVVQFNFTQVNLRKIHYPCWTNPSDSLIKLQPYLFEVFDNMTLAKTYNIMNYF